MLNPEHVTLQQKEHWATETLSAPSQTLITFLLTRSPLCYQLSGPCVLFRTINLALFTLVKITHPDTCREGLMTAPMDRLVRSVEVDDGWLMWWLLARKLCLHFSSCTYFPPCSFFCTYLQAGHSISAYISFSLPHIFLSSPSSILKHVQTTHLSCCPLNLLTRLPAYRNYTWWCKKDISSLSVAHSFSLQFFLIFLLHFFNMVDCSPEKL